MSRLALIFLISISALGALRAQSGSFIIPDIRASSGTDFAYWDLFARPPGAPTNTNYNYPNPPALADGFGEDDDGNLTTAFAPRATLTQNGTPNCFITSSGAIYSFSDTISFEVDYQAPTEKAGEVSNVIFQTQTGGSRLNVNGIQLRYTNGAETVSLNPIYRALDDPQSGAFSERIVCAFQWDLTGLNVRHFKIVFAAPGASMPLWQAQIDTVIGQPFEQQLGYLLATRSRPLTRHERAGAVDKNLPITVDDRYFLPGESLNLLSDPEGGWVGSGWYYNGQATPGTSLPLIFPAQDITVTALFAPQNYATWRNYMFYHANQLLGTENDHTDDTISAAAVDHDEDELNNAGEYAFAGNPYTADDARTRPQMLVVDADGTLYPALRYRTNGAPMGVGDCVFNVRVSSDGGTSWTDNSTAPGTTVTHLRELQADGSALITERTSAPLSSFSEIEMDVNWSAAGVDGEPRAPLPLAIVTDAALPAGTMGVSYSQSLGQIGGASPYTWQITGGSLPAGLTLSDSGMLTGIPTVSGPQAFTVELEDALGANVDRAFTLNLAPFEITTNGALATTALNQPFNQQLALTGGTGDYTWSLASGSTLPAGLTINSSGLLSGAPTELGSFVFTVQVTDTTPLTVSRAFTLRVIELGILSQTLPGAVAKITYSTMLQGTGGTTPYTWTLVSGEPPAGITLAPSGTLSGTPTTAGTATFTVQLQDADGFTAMREVTLAVTEKHIAPVVNAPNFPVIIIGTSFSHTITATNYPKTFSATGLPKGLKITAASGLISGRPEVAGVFNIQLQATNTGGKSLIRTFPLVVKALDKELVGSFTALIDRHPSVNNRLGSRLELTTTSKGSYSVRIITGTKPVNSTGFLAASAPQVTATLNGQPLSLSIDDHTGAVTGTHGTASLNGWRSNWHAQNNPADTREGYYSFAMDLADPDDDGVVSIPQGSGFASFSIALNGALTVSGKAADGETITSAGILGPQGQIHVYAPLYKGLGSLTGELTVSEDAQGEFWENTITSSHLTWFKPTTTTRTYSTTFGPLDLAASGKYLAATNKEIALGLPETGSANLSFSDGGLNLSVTDPDMSFTYTDDNKVAAIPANQNPNKVSVAIHKSTGLVSGNFTLVEPAPAPLTRAKVPFLGQIVRKADGSVKAVGYFLLPQIPVGTQKPTTSPILSGGLRITQ